MRVRFFRGYTLGPAKGRLQAKPDSVQTLGMGRVGPM